MKPDCQIIQGDCRSELAKLPEKSVHCTICSPPYWGLRRYEGVEPSVWGDGDKWCAQPAQRGHQWREDGFCDRLCGAWKGLLGLEPTIEMYVEHIVECFRAVKRVLRDDGTLWLNLGDSYAASGEKRTGRNDSGEQRPGFHGQSSGYGGNRSHVNQQSGLAPKNLIGQPWRVAFALQADGWILRSAMPWVKRSAMPEAVTDRPTSALEYVFLFAKSPRYFWDAEAIRVKAAPATHQRDKYSRILEDDGPQAVRHDHETQVDAGGRNFRNTDLFFESLKPPFGMIFVGDEPVGLDVTSAGLNEKHYASFPRKLIRPLILASTSSKGCCPECHTPWMRVLEKSGGLTGQSWHSHDHDGEQGNRPGFEGHRRAMADAYEKGDYKVKTLGWEPGCKCVSNSKLLYEMHDGTKGTVPTPYSPVPCTVLDPFCGSGTSLIVATQQGRRGIGIDASPEYCAMARRRIADPEPEPEIPDVEGQMTFDEVLA